MPLKYFKPLEKVQTVNKPQNEKNKEKFKMFYTEVYDVSPRQKIHTSRNLHSELHNVGLLSENLPEILDLLGDKLVENKSLDMQKVKSKEINSHKRKNHDINHRSNGIISESKNEKDKVNPALKGEIPIRKRDYIVKQIPLKKDLLEFSIDRSHCPMVVRIHKGRPNTSKHKKHGSEESCSQQVTHSRSCPPRISKITSDNTASQNKQKRHKSKHRLKTHGCAISELFNFSQRKTGLGTKISNSDIFADLHESDRLNSRKTLKYKSKLQNSCVNEQRCAADNIKDLNKKYATNKNSIKPHKTSKREKSKEKKRKPSQIELEGNCKPDNFNNSDILNYEYISDMYPSFAKPREINMSEGNQEYYEGIRNEKCDNKATETRQIKEKVFMKQKHNINCESVFLQNGAEGEMPINGYADCYCQKYEAEQIQRKTQSPGLPDTIKSLKHKISDPQECSKLGNSPAEKNIVPENVVILDATQSQFYKISSFINNNSTPKYCQNTKSELFNRCLTNQNNSLVINDQKYVNNTISKNNLHRSEYRQTRKVKSEEKFQNKYINDRQSGSFFNPPKYNPSFDSLNKSCYTTAHNVDYKKPKHKSGQSSPFYKCLICCTNIYNAGNFYPYCSDCNLKAKLSQISNESTSTNPDAELKVGLTASDKALTTIQESDISLSKQHVSVAIQTDCDIRKETQECNKMIIEPNIIESTNNPSNSLENMFKMYCSIASQFKRLQGSLSNIEESLPGSNNIDFTCDENLFGGDFERQCRTVEYGGIFSEKNNLSSTHPDARISLPTGDCCNCSTPNSVEPNIQHYSTTLTVDDLNGQIFATDENRSSEYQTKTLEPSFVSPIFPEKEYYRTTCSKHTPSLTRKSSKETLQDNNATNNLLITNCSQKYMPKPNLINFENMSDNNSELPEHFSMQGGKSPQKDVKSIEGSYINYEKRISFSKEINKLDSFTCSAKEKSLEGNNYSSCEIGTAVPGQMKELPDLPYSSTNIKGSVLSLDNNLKGISNKCDQRICKMNNRHTLPKATKYQNFNCLSPHQQFQNSNEDLADYHVNYDGISLSHQQEPGLTSKEESNYLNNERIVKRTKISEGTNVFEEEYLFKCMKSNTTISYKPFSFSKMDLNAQYKRVTDPTQTIKDPQKGMNVEHEVTINRAISFKDSKQTTEDTEIIKTHQHFQSTPNPADEFKLHSFSYILFKFSVKGNGYDSSEIEENSKAQVSSETGLVLASNANDDNFNDIILGSKFNTQINSRFIFKQETNNHEFNVFELNSFSRLPNVVLSESSCQIHNSENNLGKKPLVYKPVSLNVEVSDSNNVSNTGKKIDSQVSNENTLISSSIESYAGINKQQGKINNNVLKKKKTKNSMEKITNNKKPKERKKSMKINHIFMCGYMAQMSFFRFVGGLQTRVCSELRKSKFV